MPGQNRLPTRGTTVCAARVGSLSRDRPCAAASASTRMRPAANRNHNYTGGTHRCRLRDSLSAERTRTLRHHLTQLDASPRPPGRTVPWTAPSTPLTACGPPDQRAPCHRGPATCPVSCLRKRHRSVGPTAARRQVSRLSGSRSPYLDPGGRPQGRNVAVSPSPSTSRPGMYMPLGATDIVMQGSIILPPPPPPVLSTTRFRLG